MIKQIATDQGKIFGLGIDDKIYLWNHGKGEWSPYWSDKKTTGDGPASHYKQPPYERFGL